MLDDGCGDTPFFKEAIGNVTEKKEDYKNIYIQSLKIVSKLMLDYTNEMPVSHYTKTAIAERMLVGDFKEVTARSALRISSLNTSNDSSEGKILYQYLFDNQKEDKQIEDYGAFAGCFAFNNDSLNQFRLYGKTDDKEATGVSIAVNEKIFSKSITTPLQMQSDTGNKPDKEKKSPELLPLFRYIYIDPETNSVVSLGQKEKYVFLKEGKSANTYKKCKEKIDNTQKEISQELETLKEMARDLNKDIVHKLLLNLRYLIKHVAFKEEQECRIIKVAKLTGSTIKPSENNSLYIDYSEFKPDNVEKICFGRKAKEIDRFKQHLARNRYSQTECYQSKAPLI
ncbi:MAG: DUF2971 domain-containing protein [Prevotellaceae bacterium]|jgi:hypothetical protein|nr:DUF2971 domain-containing protein [Prevotellaceae bacterium]